MSSSVRGASAGPQTDGRCSPHISFSGNRGAQSNCSGSSSGLQMRNYTAATSLELLRDVLPSQSGLKPASAPYRSNRRRYELALSASSRKCHLSHDHEASEYSDLPQLRDVVQKVQLKGIVDDFGCPADWNCMSSMQAPA